MVSNNNTILKYLSVMCIIVVIIYICYIFGSSTNAHNNKTNETNETFIQETNNIGEITCYYASWCGYSKLFLPIWEEFKTYAGEKYPSLKITTVSCEGKNQSVCDSRGIKGYPTVVLTLSNGTNKEYSGKRTVNDLAAWVENEL